VAVHGFGRPASLDTTAEMKSIGKALDNVAEFLRKEDLSQDFYQSYEEKYSAPMELNNKKFWEEVFEASISFY
jgi:hypothetical protein